MRRKASQNVVEDDGRGEGELGRTPMESLEGHARAVADEINEHGDAHPAHVDALIREARRARPTHSDPDPSEGEVGCDHENTVLDDNVEWCPDCRRVMPEDAEDDGRGEGAVTRDESTPEKREFWNKIRKAASRAPTHSDADPEIEADVDDVREQSDEELVDALESLARNFCLEAGFGYAPVNLAGLEIKRRLQNRSDADPSGVDLREDAAETIDWLLDLLEMYDEKLIELGEPEEKVRSDVHLQGKAKARDILRRLRRTEDAGEEVEDDDRT